MGVTRNRMLSSQCQKLPKKLLKQERLNKVPEIVIRLREKLVVKRINL